MAMFSEGGLTSPDIWIAIAVILTASISILLNPLVFRHNVLKQRSIARDLYMVLSTTDFISSIVLTAIMIRGILLPKEEQCIRDHNATYCRTEYYKYSRAATTAEKVMGSVSAYLAFSPNTITSVMAMSRWYQISYPLRFLSRTAVKIFLAVWCLLQGLIFTVLLFIDTPEQPTLFQVHFITWNYVPFGVDMRDLPIVYILFTLQISISTIATVFTIWSMFRSHTVPGNAETGSKRMKSTVKIALLNAGAFLAAVMGLGITFSAANGKHGTEIRRIFETASYFLTIVLSTYNPVIFTLLTRKNILKRNFRVRAES